MNRASTLIRTQLRVASLALAGFLQAATPAQNCEVRWDAAFGSPGMNGIVYALASFDDGSGPALYAGGEFTMAGQVPANKIARWNGNAWAAVGGGINTLVVKSLAVFNDGSGPALYAGTDSPNVYRWDGVSWTLLGSVGQGQGQVFVLVGFDNGVSNSLYAGHQFGRRISRWNGSAWTGLESNPNAAVYCLQEFGGDLFVGGDFTTIGGNSRVHIAKYRTGWQSVPALPNSILVPLGMTVFDGGNGPRLHVCGTSTQGGGFILRLDGSTWTTLPVGGLNDRVRNLLVADDGSGTGLFVGGEFLAIGTATSRRIAKWTGTAWESLGTGIDSGPVGDASTYALCAFNDGSGTAIYAGGSFNSAGGFTANNIARWGYIVTPTTWTAPFGGAFEQTSNWSNGAPGNCNAAILDSGFQSPPAYTTFVSTDQSMHRLILESPRDVTMTLFNRNVSLRADNPVEEPALLIGRIENIDSRLTVGNAGADRRGVAAPIVTVGQTLGSRGRLTIANPSGFSGTLTAFDVSQSLTVGDEGRGALWLRADPGNLVSATVSGGLVLGRETSSLAELQLTGSGTTLAYAGAGPQSPMDVMIGDAGDAQVTLSGGCLLQGGTNVGEVRAAVESSSTVDIQLSGNGTRWTTAQSAFVLAESGALNLSLSSGATMDTTTTGELVLARNAGSSASVIVDGPTARWTEHAPGVNLVLGGEGAAVLTVLNGGTIQFPNLSIGEPGRLQGNGTVNASVVSLGRIAPGVASGNGAIGTLQVNGNYRQVGLSGTGGNGSGVVEFDVNGTGLQQFDRVAVAGSAELGGGAFINLGGGFVPSAGQPLDLPLVAAGSRVGATQFDVAYFPGIPTQPGETGRFLSIEYSPTDGGVAVNLIIADLPGDIDLNNPVGPFYDGQPTAVAIGKFDADNFDDLALTVSGPNPSLIVLRTAYNELGLYTPIPTLLGLPGQPTGLVISDLDHQSGKDVAVVMSDGAINPGQLKVFKSTGVGGSGELTFEAGIVPQTLRRDPQGISAADLDGDQSAELIISMAGENALDLFSLGNPSNMLYVPRTVCVGPRNNCTNQPSLPSDNRPVGVGLGDSNNDKNLDMAAANSGSGSITVYRNVRDVVGQIAFEEPARYVVGADPRQVLVADFNRDNGGPQGERPDDLAVLNRADGTVSILVRRPDIANLPASEWYAPPVALPIRRDQPGASDPTSIAAVDLDDDGDRELAGVAFREASSTERTVHVLRNDLNNGQLAFADAANQDAGEAPAFVAGGDLNGDGREDLVAVNGPGAGDGPLSGRVLIRLQSPRYARADCNCDGRVNNFDIDVFVLALSDPATYAAQYPNCDIRSADINGDRAVNNFDIDPFVACIASGGCQ